VTYTARSLLGQAWALLLLAAMSAALAEPAWAQGPDPAPTRVKAPRPDPAPTRSKANSQSTKTPAVTVRPRAFKSPIVVAPPAPIAPQPVSRPAPRAQVEAPKRARATKPQRARTPSRKSAVKGTLGAGQRLGSAVDSSPDGMLLAGGLALFVLLLGETIFLTLSLRFLRSTT
jgi:hypothetical protein